MRVHKLSSAQFFRQQPDAGRLLLQFGKGLGSEHPGLVNGKLPVDGKVFLTPPNALRLEWQSLGNGGWEAQVDVMRFRNRGIRFHGDMLFLWCFSPEGIPAAALPWNQADARSCGVRLDVGPLNVGRLMPFEVVQFILRLVLYFRLDVAEEF